MGTHTSPTSLPINEGAGPRRVTGPVETRTSPTLPAINEGAGPSRMSVVWQDNEMHVSKYFLNIIKSS